MTVRAAPAEHFPWLLERIRYSPSADFRAIEALDAKGEIGAMVGFDWWTPNAVQLHIAIVRPACALALLRPAFHYPFVQEGRSIALGTIPAHRQRCVELASRLGFTETARVKDGWSKGVDLITYELRKEACRWLGKWRAAT